MKKTQAVTLVAATLLASAAAFAQPQIVSLGGSSVGNAVLNGGDVIVGSVGGAGARWTIANGVVSLQTFPETRGISNISDDTLFMTGAILNTGGLGGFPTDAALTARWSQATGWTPLAFVSPDASLNVTGAGASGGEISSPRGMSSNGRFIVGQGYIAPDETYRFRGWYWDAQANGGAGESRVLPTGFNTQSNRFRDGRALDISADGAVIVGGEDPHSSEGRVIVWRWNAGTSSYDASYLPDGVDPKGNPITRSVDEFFINDAGTLIVGTTYEFDKVTGFVNGPILARWTWDEGSALWSRELIDDQLTTLPSWWVPPSWCDLPHQLIPTGMSDDGNTIVGIVMYSLCGSFQRGGFIWTAETNQIRDFYDVLVEAGTPGITDYSAVEFGLPPRLGWPNGVSADGRSFTGYGGPFSGFGPGWVVNLTDVGCVNAFITNQPEDVALSRCSTFIMTAGAGGSGPIEYLWYKDGVPLKNGGTPHGSVVSGATEEQLRIENSTLDDAGNYFCSITGACGTALTTDVAVAAPDPTAPPIENDTCATAMAVGEGTFDFSPCGAFIDDVISTGCGIDTTADAWFIYTPTFTGDARIETCGANYDTVLSVYTDCGGSEIACNDDRIDGPLNSCSWVGSRLNLPVVVGQPVAIRVAALGFLFDFSAGQLSIGVAPPAAANDLCANATPAVEGANPFNTDEASNDGGSTCGFGAFSRDVWFSYTPASNGTLSLTTCGETQWDTVISVLDGLCAGNEIACNDNSEREDCYSQSTIRDLAVQAGVTYTIRVAANFDGDSGGPGVLTLDFQSQCAADFNQDGFANSQDFFDFLTAFFGNLPSSDFNDDGFINSQDFFDFLTAFFAGC